MEKKLLIIISSISLVVFVLTTSILIGVTTLQSDMHYKKALEKYNNSEFAKASKEFKKVGRFSTLKPAAIYREGLCAGKLGNKKTELKKYEKLKKSYSKSKLTPRLVYIAGKEYYSAKKFSKALKDFKFVAKKYPKTKYALASNYYIALILSEKQNPSQKQVREIVTRSKKYLQDAPDGMYTVECIKILEKYEMSDEEKFLAGRAYLLKKDFDKALEYFQQVEVTHSWPYLVQIYSEKKDTERVRNFTRLGLASNNDIVTKEYNNAAYKAIDLYLKTFNDKKAALSSLLNLGNHNSAYDYLMFKNCQNATGDSKNLCYNSLYQIYPNGNFAADSLANVFFNNIQRKNYQEAIKLGNLHLLNYKGAKSTPKVLYWLAFVCTKTNDTKNARLYYNQLMKEYPDDYYTYLAFITTNRLKYGNQVRTIKPEPVMFPYTNTKDKLLNSLLYVEDYGIINSFYDDDDFIKSWILYQEGNFTASSRIARDAMDKLEEKPTKEDLRWRLVYPVHYMEEINRNSNSSTDKTLILSIIREESYFNPNARSNVGALGLMQLMPNTAKEIAQKTDTPLLNPTLLFDEATNIKLGKMYFSYLKSKLSGKPSLAVLAYNGGIGSVRKWQQSLDYETFDEFIEMIPYAETQNYYKKVYRTYWNYLRIYGGLNF